MNSDFTCDSLKYFLFTNILLYTHKATIFAMGWKLHYDDVIMSAMASQITSLTSVCSNFHSGVDQRIHQRSASLAFVWGIQRPPVNSPHKRPVTRKRFYLMTSSWMRLKYNAHNSRFVTFIVAWYDSIFAYHTGLFHWHRRNHTKITSIQWNYCLCILWFYSQSSA